MEDPIIKSVNMHSLFPVGSKVHLKTHPEITGTVEYMDGIGTITVFWDDRSTSRFCYEDRNILIRI